MNGTVCFLFKPTPGVQHTGAMCVIGLLVPAEPPPACFRFISSCLCGNWWNRLTATNVISQHFLHTLQTLLLLLGPGDALIAFFIGSFSVCFYSVCSIHSCLYLKWSPCIFQGADFSNTVWSANSQGVYVLSLLLSTVCWSVPGMR